MKCPYCGHDVILDTNTGQYVCPNCATVVDVVYMPSVSMLSNEPLRETRHVIDYVDVKHEDLVVRARRLTFLKKLEMIDRKLRLRNRAETRAIACLYALARKLGLDERQTEIAIELFRKIVKTYRTRTGSEGLTYYKAAAAAVLYTVIMHNIPTSPKDVVKMFQEMGHRVELSDVMNIIASVFGRFSYSTKERVRVYLNNILAKCNISDQDRMRLLRTSMEILAKLPERKIAGKNPRTLAAAIVALAAKHCSIPVVILDVASIVNVSPLTLREHVRKIQKLLEETGKVAH